MLGAELNAAIQEEWPASPTHAKRVRLWLKQKAESGNGRGVPARDDVNAPAADPTPDAATS
jgi:membrane protein